MKKKQVKIEDLTITNLQKLKKDEQTCTNLKKVENEFSGENKLHL
jgi:hypothetical protein